MDILFVANWSAPGIVGANYASSGLHLELAKRNLKVGVLSSRLGHHEANTSAVSHFIKDQPVIEQNSNAITYLLPSLPSGWSARHIHNSDWDQAVEWGVELLEKYNPKIVHVQQWQNFWWMAEAASRCSIPLNYTPYDFGLVCARTVLIKSDGSKCDGNVSRGECEACIYNGRGWIGKLNENLVKIPIFAQVLKVMAKNFPQLKLYERGIVLDPITVRLNNDRIRLRQFLMNVNTLVVNSNFSKRLFGSLGANKNVKKISWFHNLNITNQSVKTDFELSTVGFVGRVSPEKGLEILLESLKRLRDLEGKVIKLVVAGDADSTYAFNLQKKYSDLDVDWLGWVDSSLLSKVYDQLDMLVVPSVSYDNGPICIMEAIATRTPVLVPDNETLLSYLSGVKSDHVFESGSSNSLAKLILKYATKPDLLELYVAEIPEAMTVVKYVDELMPTFEAQLISEGS